MKNKLFSIVLIFALLISCSSGDLTDDSNNSDSVLIKHITFSDSSMHIFMYNGNKLQKISVSKSGNGTDYYVVYTYNGDLITNSESFDINNVLGTRMDCSYANNKLMQVKYLRNNLLSLKYDFVYNSDGTTNISSTIYPDNGIGPITVFEKRYYDSAGNIIKIVRGNSSWIYTYDNKNNPYKNVMDRININLWDQGYSANNNISITEFSGISKVHSTLRTYQYNSQNYPISCSSSIDGRTPSITNYYY